MFRNQKKRGIKGGGSVSYHKCLNLSKANFFKKVTNKYIIYTEMEKWRKAMTTYIFPFTAFIRLASLNYVHVLILTIMF